MSDDLPRCVRCEIPIWRSAEECKAHEAAFLDGRSGRFGAAERLIYAPHINGRAAHGLCVACERELDR